MSRHLLSKSALVAAALAVTLTIPAIVQAAPADPAAQTIEGFDTALIATMKKGDAAARFKTIEPAVNAAFDLPTMTRFAVGPDWATIAPADQAALLSAFTRFTSANYAKSFSSYSGQTIKVMPDVETRGVDKLVTTQMGPGSDPVVLKYRMRQAAGGTWKVIDVYYNGTISQLTTQRSDFADTFKSGGAKALIQKINAQSDKLLK